MIVCTACDPSQTMTEPSSPHDTTPRPDDDDKAAHPSTNGGEPSSCSGCCIVSINEPSMPRNATVPSLEHVANRTHCPQSDGQCVHPKYAT